MKDPGSYANPINSSFQKFRTTSLSLRECRQAFVAISFRQCPAYAETPLLRPRDCHVALTMTADRAPRFGKVDTREIARNPGAYSGNILR